MDMANIDLVKNIGQFVLLAGSTVSLLITNPIRKEYVWLAAQLGYVVFNIRYGLQIWAIGSTVWSLISIRNLIRLRKSSKLST